MSGIYCIHENFLKSGIVTAIRQHCDSLVTGIRCAQRTTLHETSISCYRSFRQGEPKSRWDNSPDALTRLTAIRASQNKHTLLNLIQKNYGLILFKKTSKKCLTNVENHAIIISRFKPSFKLKFFLKKEVQGMKIIGYCRVSTKKQSIERQSKNIKANYPDAEIYADEFTGTTMNRPQWNKMVNRIEKMISEGETITIVFDSVSRMSRTAKEGFDDYKQLFSMGVTLVFLNEPYVNSDVYKQAMQSQCETISANTGDSATDKLIDTIMNAIKEYQLALVEKQIQLAFEQSEKEVKDIQQRTKEGMKASGAGEKIRKARTGKQYTTKKEMQAKEVILKHSRAFGGTLKDEECRKLCGISLATFYEYKKELKTEMERDAQ